MAIMLTIAVVMIAVGLYAYMVDSQTAAAVLDYEPGDIVYGQPIHAIHEMGGACMGRDPRASVLNGWNQAHDVPNLYVTDGAAMCSTSVVNPTLTFMALTARAADHAAARWREGVV